MRTHVITGSAGGLGLALRDMLEAQGDKVIGVDVRDADVIADLSTPSGRSAMVDDIRRLCGGKLDGVVANAGVLHPVGGSGALASSVNYFGAVASLNGLRPMLAESTAPRAIAVCSNSMGVIPIHRQLLEFYATGDETSAREYSNQVEGGPGVYPTSKFGLAQWVRKQAPTAEWIGCGIALNGLAPGLIATPMNSDEELAEIMKLNDAYPIPAARPATPDEIAGLMTYLLSEQAGFICGSILNIDGGTDAVMRPDLPSAIALV